MLDALTNSSLSEALRAHGWVWPTLEIFHLCGMILLFGSLLIFDLRVLGYAPQIPIAATTQLLKYALIGFCMNLISGSLLVLGAVHHFLSNPAFLLKMTLIIAAGLNACFFHVFIHNGAVNNINSRAARISAICSLVLWASIITLARFIAYIESI